MLQTCRRMLRDSRYRAAMCSDDWEALLDMTKIKVRAVHLCIPAAPATDSNLAGRRRSSGTARSGEPHSYGREERIHARVQQGHSRHSLRHSAARCQEEAQDKGAQLAGSA